MREQRCWQEKGVPVVTPDSVDEDILRQVHPFYLRDLFEILCSPGRAESSQVNQKKEKTPGDPGCCKSGPPE